MSDIKWIKITTNMFEDEKIRLIDAMPERDTIHYIWIRLLVQAGKNNANGFIFLSENIPYSEEMLSTIFCRPITSIRLALKTLKDFAMIEIDEDNLIRIANWDKHQNIEGMERVRAQGRKRVENHRERKKQLKELGEGKKSENLIEESSDNISNESEDINTLMQQDNYVQNSNSNEANEDNFVRNSEENSCNAMNIKSNVTNNSCNITENESNVTVTEQNKIENKNKNKIESKNNNTGDINKKDLSCQDGLALFNFEESQELNNSQEFNISYTPNNNPKENISGEAGNLLKHYEQLTGRMGGLDLGSLKLAISMHGKEHVRSAIDRSIEVNKPDMKYINGILKNWRREGYPKEKEEIINGAYTNGKNKDSNANEFKGFRPKQPKGVRGKERRNSEEKLI
ncbi:phage replisome organizer N-terminal domain-containing protein [Clostridium uliginosum]|uniref:Phage replisome organizer, putative, N-terminal region n=1 Tax=Clostridium uliginosum TaxID=119641 RepID=A0A1I1NPX6_9CLOT|nr:phage replisome organizer N-terminal domain-containing protein [Clostridium uliginosum]SFC99332.1 phage replisome organizer, putative, N-terminal region [Clostridium uliginosum]